MNQPLRSILHKPDLFGRMLRWAIELSEYGIKYQPKLAMKGQVMADFIAEVPHKPSQLVDSLDGASKVSRSRIGLLLQSPTGKQIERAI